MIRVCTVGKDLDTERAYALQYSCFRDEKEWFDGFLDAAKGQRYIAYTIEEDYVGGLFLLDMTYGGYVGSYVYALGVHPDYRGKGIARELLQKAKALCKDFCLICAADEPLAETYARNGFDTYVGGTVAVGASHGAAVAGKFDTPCTYADVRGLKLSEPLFDFALSECSAALYTDGSTVVAKAQDGVYAAWGVPPTCEKKAQLYLKTDMDTSGITADLILEI